mmetsp:Transcript_1232/g.3303  ORF Transcript_1232/g.3303 Transcript_1232/m.3303 type:complete len:563 (-) Transcript_1232:196-1884(-)
MEHHRARKNELLQEFNTRVAPQKLKLEQVLPSLWKQSYAAPQTLTLAAGAFAAAPSTAAAAVSAASPAFAAQAGVKPEPPPAAAPRTTPPQAAAPINPIERKVLLFRECAAILKKVRDIKAAEIFRKPVSKDQPRYYDVVQKPIDMKTVSERLSKRIYNSPMDFKEDMDQMWVNCFLYNLPDSDAHKNGVKCQRKCEELWQESNLEDRWLQLQLELNPSAPLHTRADILNNQLIKAVVQLKSDSPDALQERKMTFAEKRLLSISLSQLQSAEQCHAVLDIVSLDPNISKSTEGHIELDLDHMNPATLWKLHALLDPGEATKPIAADVPPSSAPATGGASFAQNGGAARLRSVGQEQSGQNSPMDVKGSSLEAPGADASFVRAERDAGNMVDESATAPKEQSMFVKDRPAVRKPDVAINSADWNSLTADDDAGPKDKEPEAGDDVWESFKSMAEQKQKKEEQQREEAEKADRLRQEAAERQKREEEDRQQKLREEEQRLEEDKVRQREEQKQKELAEMEAKDGKTDLTQKPADMTDLEAPSNVMAELGLQAHQADEDMNFDDE